jgi:cation diffusion facilitator family transporter
VGFIAILAIAGARLREPARLEAAIAPAAVSTVGRVEAVALAERKRLHRRGIRLEWFTVAWNVTEAAVALTAGILAGSIALVGFGVDSGIEVVAAGAVLWRFRAARAGATKAEHSRAERRALYVVSTTFFLLAAYIAFEGVTALAGREEPDRSFVGLVLSIVSLAVMPSLAYAKQQTGRQLRSSALQADAVETWVCAYLSLALLIGVGLHVAFEWWWADPLGALAMLPVIVWQGWQTLEEARESEE